MKWTLDKKKFKDHFDIYDLHFSRNDLIDMCHGSTYSVKTKTGDLIVITRE